MNIFYPNPDLSVNDAGIIGQIDNHLVTYNKSNDTISCKQQSINSKQLIDAYNSKNDREELTDVLTLTKDNQFFTLGCFTLNKDSSFNLIKKLINVRKRNPLRTK